MKSLALATILLSLSGTALSAVIDTSQLAIPSIVKSNINAAQQKVSAEANPIQSFVKQSTDSLNGLYAQKNQLLKEKGYLKGNPILNLVDQTLNETKKNLTTLAQAENAYSTVSSNLAGLPLLLAYLNTITPSTDYPGVCKTYTGEKVTGIITTMAGALTFYDPHTNKYYQFLSESTDVGLIDSGAEYPPSLTPNGKAVDGYLGTDPLTQKKGVVVCLSQPYSPSTPLVPPTTDSAKTSISSTKVKPAGPTTETKK